MARSLFDTTVVSKLKFELRFVARICCWPKAELAFRTPRRFAREEAAEIPPGLGVRARERRFSLTPDVSEVRTLLRPGTGALHQSTYFDLP